uniref:Uncharacterized protein n=1 Tax=Avena sativa TaxID=4498 RepID=A0ACD5WTF4_AVESA
METTLRFREQLKVEVDSPPLSPRSSDDEDETDPDDSDGEEVEGGDGAGTGAGAVVSGPPLKKGPWTPDEDKRLRTYVEANGEGNWNHVQRNAGLNRCGKSCRLRWANHLRPHLKKGPFSEEEELKIIELHAMHGNKWAMMANQLPGRTDNEIKNFWNTRSKRRAKAGLGLYPDGLLSRVQNQDMDSHSPDDLHGKKRPNELSQGNGLVFDDIIFEKLDYKKRAENFLAPPSMIQDSLPLDAMNQLKRHASSDMVSGYGASPRCELFPHEPEKICYTNICLKNQSVPFNNAIANGPPIFSTSGTIQRPIKMEPPSFQNTNYELSYPVTPLCDNLISSPASVLTKPDYFPSQNNGLLDAMVQQGHVPGYEASVPPVVYFSSHPSVLDDNVFEDGPFNEFRTSKSSASLDAFWADSHLLPLIDHCINDGSTKAGNLNEGSPHSEYQPINQSMKVMFYGNYCDEVQLLAPGDGHSLELESVPWNSMPGACHLSESSNVSQQQL